MPELVAVAQRLAETGVYLFFRHRGRFLNPLVPRERDRLAEDPPLANAAVRQVVTEVLPRRSADLGPGIYFPTPIASGLEHGEDLDAVLLKYRYEFIQVDDAQVWHWRGEEIAPRVRRLFLEHLTFEPALDLYVVEYRVNSQWWDKCYLEAEVTPMLGRRVDSTPAGGLSVVLNNGERDVLDPTSFRVDGKERLLCRSRRHGEVLLGDSARLQLLQGISDDGERIRVGEEWFPLRF